jgi:hypothetical protein
MKDATFRQKATDFYVKIESSRADDCLQQLAELRRSPASTIWSPSLASADASPSALLNVRLFADRVMPALQHDPPAHPASPRATRPGRSAVRRHLAPA